MSKPDLLRKISDEAAVFHLRSLVETCPNFEAAIDDDVWRWLGKLAALVDEVLSVVDVSELRTATRLLEGNRAAYGESIKRLLFSALAAAELSLPIQSQGSFIAAGNQFDAFAAISKILAEAQNHVLLIDPYMDAVVLTDFAVLAPDGVSVLLLTDEATVKPSLLAAVPRWLTQQGGVRPLEIRFAPARSLHDRSIIIDDRAAWIATQSFKDIAARSPASFSKLDGDAGKLKIDAYETIWAQAKPVS